MSTGDRAGLLHDRVMTTLFDPRDAAPMPRDDDVARLRVPPHSVEAEQSVLGGLLLDNLAWDRAADLLTDVGIDAAIRGRDKPSDHVPVWVDLGL